MTYLSENEPLNEKTCFCRMWTTKAQISLRIHAVWSAPLLFAAWIVTRLYNSKIYSSIGTYTVPCGKRLQLVKSKFHPAGMVYTDSVSLCRLFVINRFDKKKKRKKRKKNDFVTFGTRYCEWTVKSKFIEIYSKRIFPDIIYVKIRLLFSYCWQYERGLLLAWKTTKASKGRPRVVCVRYVPSDLKRTEKYGSLNGTLHSAQFQFGYWHHDIPNTNITFRSRHFGTFRQALLKSIHLPSLSRIFTIGF